MQITIDTTDLMTLSHLPAQRRSAAVATLMAGYAASAEGLTDGRVWRDTLSSRTGILGGVDLPGVLGDLAEAGLVTLEDDLVTIPGYLRHNRSRVQVERDRSQSAKAMRAYRARLTGKTPALTEDELKAKRIEAGRKSGEARRRRADTAEAAAGLDREGELLRFLGDSQAQALAATIKTPTDLIAALDGACKLAGRPLSYLGGAAAKKAAKEFLSRARATHGSTMLGEWIVALARGQATIPGQGRRLLDLDWLDGAVAGLQRARATSPEAREQIREQIRTADPEGKTAIVEEHSDTVLWGAWALGYQRTYGEDPQVDAESLAHLHAMAERLGGPMGVSRYLAWRWSNWREYLAQKKDIRQWPCPEAPRLRVTETAKGEWIERYLRDRKPAA